MTNSSAVVQESQRYYDQSAFGFLSTTALTLGFGPWWSQVHAAHGVQKLDGCGGQLDRVRFAAYVGQPCDFMAEIAVRHCGADLIPEGGSLLRCNVCIRRWCRFLDVVLDGLFQESELPLL